MSNFYTKSENIKNSFDFKRLAKYQIILGFVQI